MKSRKEKNKIIALVVLTCLLGVLLGYLLIMAPHAEEKIDDEADQFVTTESDIEINTPFVVLHYPAQWKENLQIRKADGEVYTVEFYGKVAEKNEQHIFDVTFGGGEGSLIGNVPAEDGQFVDVRLYIFPFEPGDAWSEGEADTIFAMMEDVDYLIDQLNEVEIDIETDDLIVETPFTPLRFSGQWKEYLRTEIQEEDGYTVAFYANINSLPEQHLFDVCFCVERDKAMFTIQTNDASAQTVSIKFYERSDTEAWTQDEEDLFYAMQEGVNYLIENLKILENDMLEEIVIATPYGRQLRYPGKWESKLRIEYNDVDGYTIAFYGVTSDREQHLFDICFDCEQGTYLGAIEMPDSEEISVNLVVYQIEGSWTQEETETFLAMQEDVNYLIEKLVLNTQEESIAQTEAILVDTPYGTLKYETAWKADIYVEKAEQDDFALELYGKVSDKTKQPIFTIFFDSDKGVPCGILLDAEGNEIQISVSMEEPVFDKSWTESEKNKIYAMQEDVNDLLNHLSIM